MEATPPTNVPSSEATASLNLIPETLLALAKDERYVEQCSSLLQDIFEKLQRRGYGNFCSSSEEMTAYSKALSWLLFAILVVRRSGKDQTLGMEYTSLLKNGDGENMRQSRRGRRIWTSMTFMACANLAFQYYYYYNFQKANRRNDENFLLHGNSRRQFHEQQRQAMLDRAAGAADEFVSTTTDDRLASTTRQTSFLKRIHSFIVETFKELSVSSGQAHGPHSIPSTDGTNTTTMSTAKWILKLHLAHYLWTGSYPSLLYRFAGITRLESGATNKTGLRVIAQAPTTHKTIAALIFLQAISESIKWTGNKVALWLIKRRQERLKKECPTSVDEAWDYSNSTRQSLSHIMCSICGIASRRDPAVPKACGHVFCWDCLQQAVQRRPECPLCRAKCRPQDVLMLHEFATTSTTAM